MKEQRKLAAIMFTDIAGYSALMAKDEKLAMGILVKNRNIHKSAIEKFNGEYIKEIGDGTLAIFQSSMDAVSCAIRIMKSCKKDASFSVRIGIHIGDVILREGDVFGDCVNIAARIEAGGKPGGIYVSERVYEDIKNKLSIRTEFVGEKILKNIDRPVRVYSIDPKYTEQNTKFDPVSTEHSIIAKPEHYTKKRIIPKTLLFIGIGAVIFITIGLFMFILPTQKSELFKQRIVVAIFENRTGDASLDELGKIAADWITQRISRTGEIDVVPTTTVMQLSGAFSTTPGGMMQSDYLQQLTRETKAGVVISGSYYLQNETLQFQAEVKNMEDGRLIYSLPAMAGSIEQPMEMIEKLSGEIAGGLAYHLKLTDIRFISKPPNIDAYSKYMAGLELFGKDYEGAIHLFMSAVRLDSLFMAPFLYISAAYANQNKYAEADSVVQIISRNRERLTPFERHRLDYHIAHLNGNNAECLRQLYLAESISPGDRTTNYLIGLYAVYLNKPMIAVERFTNFVLPDSYYSFFIGVTWQLDVFCEALHLLGDYKRELDIARTGQRFYPDWLWFYGGEVRALAAKGQLDEINSVIDKCQTISSRSGTVGDVIITAALELRAHGHVSEGQEYAIRAVEWYRNRRSGEEVREELAYALYTAGKWQEAQSLFEQLATEKPQEIDYFGFLGTLAAHRGDREKAMFVSDSLKRIDRPYLFGQHTYWRARIAALLGEQKEAVELLQEAFAQGKNFGVYLHRTIDFEPLKDYPPYQELLKPKE